MRDHITPVMHRQFMSMSEREIASAENRNMTPEHPNPKSLIPSNLLDSLSELPPSPPSHTNGLSPSVTKETHPVLPKPDPQTPPSPGSPQPPSPPPSRLQALSRQQQWLFCAQEQTDTWKPRKSELENLDKKLQKKVRFTLPPNAIANGEEDLDSKQEQPPQTPSPHPLPSHPPNGSLPTQPRPYHNNANGHTSHPPNGSLPTHPNPHPNNENSPTTPALHYIDHKLLKIQTQRLTEEETHSAELPPHASFARRFQERRIQPCEEGNAI